MAGTDSPAVSGWIRPYHAGIGEGWHIHDEGQLLYVDQGALRVRTQRECWIAPAMTGIWLPGGQTHSWQPLADTRVISLYLPWENRNWEETAAARHISPLLHTLLSRTIDEQNREYLGLTLPLIRSELDSSAVGTAVWLTQPPEGPLTAICRHLNDNPADNRPLAWWSGHSDVHPRTLERYFVRQTGLTFGGWRQQNRLQHAIAALAKGQPVKQVAAGLGYLNARSFNDMFKKTLGITPARFLVGRD